MNHLFSEHLQGIAVTVIIILQVTFFMFCAASLLHHIASRPQGEEGISGMEYYTSVRVHSGESLWDISKRYYSSEYKSMNQYIRKIKYLNHMSDENLYAGSYLIIPYYE